MSINIYKYKSPRSPALVIRAKELSELLGVAQSTIHRWRLVGILPEPLKLGRGFVVWKRTDIDAWLKDKGETQ